MEGNKLNIGLKENVINKISNLISSLLSDQFVLYSKIWIFHWNVTGNSFDPFHKFFGELYDEMEDIVDDSAERIRALGKKTPLGLNNFLKMASIKDNTNSELEDLEMIGILLTDYQSIIRKLRELLEYCGEVKDEASIDLFGGQIRIFEKRAWMLRSFLS